MAQRKVFYSWQSDLPNSTNRGFIEKQLEYAAKSVAGSEEPEIDPVIDRDTQGEAGAPEIYKTICNKIREADVFVCDVSIINAEGSARPMPNPNVLIELGYAMRGLPEQQIILVMNTAFGGPEKLPFDLRGRRVLTYFLDKEGTEKPDVRNELRSKLDSALRLILEHLVRAGDGKQVTAQKSSVDLLKEYVVDDRHKIQLFDLLRTHTDELVQTLTIENYPMSEPYPSGENLIARMKSYEKNTAPLLDLIAYGCFWGSASQSDLWVAAIERSGALHNEPAYSGRVYWEWEYLKHYPALLLLYAGCYAAMARSEYRTMRAILTKPRIELRVLEGSTIHTIVEAPERELNHYRVMELSHQKTLPGMQNQQYPLSGYIEQLLRPIFKPLIADEREYREKFDRLEYFLAVNYVDVSNGNNSSFFPHGSFIWRDKYDKFRKGFEKEMVEAASSWEPLNAGFFGGSAGRLLRAKTVVDSAMNRHP